MKRWVWHRKAKTSRYFIFGTYGEVAHVHIEQMWQVDYRKSQDLTNADNKWQDAITHSLD